MEKKQPEETCLKTAFCARENTIGLEKIDRIKSMMRKIPRIEPPAGLLSSVMEAVRTRRVPLWLRTYRWATSLRSFTFTPLRLATSTAFSVLLVFSALLLHDGGNHKIALDNSKELIPVEFALDMPDAHLVQVVGSFNNWVPQPCELHQEEGSARWMLTLRLQPGRYEYAFLIDGKHVPHPGAEFNKDDGFGNQNTVLALGPEDDI